MGEWAVVTVKKHLLPGILHECHASILLEFLLEVGAIGEATVFGNGLVSPVGVHKNKLLNRLPGGFTLVFFGLDMASISLGTDNIFYYIKESPIIDPIHPVSEPFTRYTWAWWHPSSLPPFSSLFWRQQQRDTRHAWSVYYNVAQMSVNRCSGSNCFCPTKSRRWFTWWSHAILLPSSQRVSSARKKAIRPFQLRRPRKLCVLEQYEFFL